VSPSVRATPVGHQIYMGSFFLSPALFGVLHSETINCCGTVRQNSKGLPQNFGQRMTWTG
jgi:hypothetical protein